MAVNVVNVYRNTFDLLTKQDERLSSQGFLIGSKFNEANLQITGCSHCTTKDLVREAGQLTSFLGGGVQIIGFYMKCDSKEDDTDLLNKVQITASKIVKSKEYVVMVLKSNTPLEHTYMCSEDQSFSKVNIQLLDSNVMSRNAVIKTHCSLNLSISAGEKSDSWKTSLTSQINDLYNRLNSASVVLHMDNSNVLLKMDRVCGIPEKCCIADLYNYVDSDNDFVQTKQKKTKASQNTLHSTLYFQNTGKISAVDSLDCAPVIQLKFENFKNVQMTLPINTVTMISPNMQLTELLPLVTTAVCNQLIAMKNCILRSTQKMSFHVPLPYHFLVSDSFLCTIVYPKGIEEEDLEVWRREYHTLFCQSTDRPVFRRGNEVLFPEDKTKHPYLINPHTGLSTNTVKDGKQYLVQGLYSYHHYMQDRFDDDKWGCAYRSLQTLVSWFIFQGYTKHAIPSHREIQQALVDVGDKEAKFVGSRQWIGSMEVSYCLDHLIGVTSKIMFVNTGAEMGSKGRELAMHFQTQGTPIMIGGGVLAHTILGVDFNEVSGDIKFLILDPHYTGAEDLRVIQDKGWCGWKGPDFWEKTAHYNLCMPQRPKVI